MSDNKRKRTNYICDGKKCKRKINIDSDTDSNLTDYNSDNYYSNNYDSDNSLTDYSSSSSDFDFNSSDSSDFSINSSDYDSDSSPLDKVVFIFDINHTNPKAIFIKIPGDLLNKHCYDFIDNVTYNRVFSELECKDKENKKYDKWILKIIKSYKLIEIDLYDLINSGKVTFIPLFRRQGNTITKIKDLIGDYLYEYESCLIEFNKNKTTKKEINKIVNFFNKINNNFNKIY